MGLFSRMLIDIFCRNDRVFNFLNIILDFFLKIFFFSIQHLKTKLYTLKYDSMVFKKHYAFYFN